MASEPLNDPILIYSLVSILGILHTYYFEYPKILYLPLRNTGFLPFTFKTDRITFFQGVNLLTTSLCC